MGEEYYSKQEVADRLKVSYETIGRMVKRGELPHFVFGKRQVRIPSSEVERYIDSRMRGIAQG